MTRRRRPLLASGLSPGTRVREYLPYSVHTPEPFGSGDAGGLSPVADHCATGDGGVQRSKGTVNLITADKIQQAAKLVKAGITVSMARPVPQKVDADVGAERRSFTEHNPHQRTGTTDTYQVSYHDSVVSHMDRLLSRVVRRPDVANGHPVKDSVTPETGCKTGDVMNLKDGITTRAVLYDIPQLKGVDWIEPGAPITRANLEAWERKAGVRVGPGDILVLCVGRWKRREALVPPPRGGPGLLLDTIPLFKERDIEFAAHDFNVDWGPRHRVGRRARPAEQSDSRGPHQWMGAGVVENLNLEQVVRDRQAPQTLRVHDDVCAHSGGRRDWVSRQPLGNSSRTRHSLSDSESPTRPTATVPAGALRLRPGIGTSSCRSRTR